MKILTKKRCIIGESPIWNVQEKKLYFTNGFGGQEICVYDLQTDSINIRTAPVGVAACAFDFENRLIISHENGVHILNKDNTLDSVYDAKYYIRYANDMKVGPDGAIYVGTQSGKRKGVSDKLDGKLYRISQDGRVDILLDGMILSNGMEWSIDETKFYHTDSDTNVIKEYNFDINTGKIIFTGRQVRVEGVDGFTIGYDNCLYVSCWGHGHIAVVNIQTMQIIKYILVPYKIPTSCVFCGENLDVLAITSASAFSDLVQDKNAGFTFLTNVKTKGRKPYLFGRSYEK